MKKLKIALIGFFILLFVSTSYAHFLWLNVDDYTPEKGKEVKITFGWGHKFSKITPPPKEELIKKLSIFVIDPDGKKIDLKVSLKNGKPQPIKFRVSKNGIYLVIATGKFFVSKTTEGYFLKAKDELKDKDVIYSKWSEITAIAIISVGKKRKNKISVIPNSNFYMIPLFNPSHLKTGEFFQVKVIFKNKPYRTWVYATYMGFSKFKDTYAWTTKTDKKGIANIKLLKIGRPWLLMSGVAENYPDSSKADVASYKCTMTFGF